MLFSSEDWRHSYAALMVLSQIGEYVTSPTHIAPEVTTIVSFF
jgi:hypothetical protein